MSLATANWYFSGEKVMYLMEFESLSKHVRGSLVDMLRDDEGLMLHPTQRDKLVVLLNANQDTFDAGGE